MAMAFGNDNDNIKDNDIDNDNDNDNVNVNGNVNVNDNDNGSVNNGTSLLDMASSLSVLPSVCSSSLSFSCSSFLYSIHDFSSSSP